MTTIQKTLPRPVARRTPRLHMLNPLLVSGLIVLLALVLFTVVGGLLADHTHAQVGAFAPRQMPNAERILGTDSQGRDVLTVLILSTPNTLMIGLVAGLVGIVIGTILGLVSGFFGGWIDTIIRVVTDVLVTIPGIAILIVIATNIRNIDVTVMALIVASLAWRFPARAIRAQTLSLRERGYIQVARLNGVGGLELVIREVLPNLLPYIAASFVSTVSQSILSTIGLEALGLGPQNEYTLGMMIYWAQFYGAILRGMWWWWTPPIVIIVLIFIGLLLTSAGMDELVNTRLRKTR